MTGVVWTVTMTDVLRDTGRNVNTMADVLADMMLAVVTLMGCMSEVLSVSDRHPSYVVLGSRKEAWVIKRNCCFLALSPIHGCNGFKGERLVCVCGT